MTSSSVSSFVVFCNVTLKCMPVVHNMFIVSGTSSFAIARHKLNFIDELLLSYIWTDMMFPVCYSGPILPLNNLAMKSMEAALYKIK